ncbi:MAG: DUF167 domain-containing protein [Spirochaetes bacterium]|jgi:hypothetical protein|nr:DUF167 domain-containing protein [Spirochaetota bacterium]
MGKEALLEITVSPRSSKSIIKIDRDAVKVYLNSPPVDGKANEECVKLFSKQLKVPKSAISIIRGEKGKRKVLEIQGMTLEEIMNVLKA